MEEKQSPDKELEEMLKEMSQKESQDNDPTPILNQVTLNVQEGTFDLSYSLNGETKMVFMSIKFIAGVHVPASESIRLLQIVRYQVRSTPSDPWKDYVWTGDESERNRLKTDAASGITPGYFVDIKTASVQKVKDQTGASLASPYYADYMKPRDGQHGSKQDDNVAPAFLVDRPSSPSPEAWYSFETVAKCPTSKHIYGVVLWGFTINANKTISWNTPIPQNTSSATFQAAVEKFNQLYNRGNDPTSGQLPPHRQ